MGKSLWIPLYVSISEYTYIVFPMESCVCSTPTQDAFLDTRLVATKAVGLFPSSTSYLYYKMTLFRLLHGLIMCKFPIMTEMQQGYYYLSLHLCK